MTKEEIAAEISRLQNELAAQEPEASAPVSTEPLSREEVAMIRAMIAKEQTPPVPTRSPLDAALEGLRSRSAWYEAEMKQLSRPDDPLAEWRAVMFKCGRCFY